METIQKAIIIDHKWVLGVAFLFSSCITWIAYRFGFFRFPSQKRVHIGHVTFKSLMGVFFVFLTLQLLLFPAAMLLFLSIKEGSFFNAQEPLLDIPGQGYLNVFSMTLSFFALLVYCRSVTPKSFAAIWGKGGEDKVTGFLKQFFWGCLTWLICYPLVLVLSRLVILTMQYFFQLPEVEQTPVQALTMTLDYPILFFAMVVTVVVFAPLIEEILFRGYLQTWFVSKFGRKWAIIASSIIFALFHYSYSLGLGNIQFFIPLFVLSCFLGLIYERQGSLWAPIGLHAFFNTASVIAIVVNSRI